MFGKYFKHVLVLTLLAGVAYSLPQVKDAMVGAFGFAGSNGASVINYNSSDSFVSNEMATPVIQIEREEGATQYVGDLPPAEIMDILVKTNVIPKEKAEIGVMILKEQLDKRDRENASGTRAMMLQNTSTTPENL